MSYPSDILGILLSKEYSQEKLQKHLKKYPESVFCKTEHGTFVLELACYYKKTAAEKIRLLLEAGANPRLNSQPGVTLLHYCSLWGNADALSLVLSLDIDINVVDKQGATPLHYACSQKNIETIIALLENGADISVVNKKGQTPFDETDKKFLGKVYLYYFGKGDFKIADWLEEKYQLKISDIL